MLSLNRLESRPPRSYRHGVLLNHIQNNLLNVHSDLSTCGRELLVNTRCGIGFTVRETTQQNFLQYTALATFVLPLPHLVLENATRICLSHTGWLRRRGVHAQSKSRDTHSMLVVQKLLSTPALLDSLMKLDFTRCEILGSDGLTRVELCLYGASEVVSRFPAFRRYIALDHEQQEALVGSFRGLLALDPSK